MREERISVKAKNLKKGDKLIGYFQGAIVTDLLESFTGQIEVGTNLGLWIHFAPDTKVSIVRTYEHGGDFRTVWVGSK